MVHCSYDVELAPTLSVIISLSLFLYSQPSKIFFFYCSLSHVIVAYVVCCYTMRKSVNQLYIYIYIHIYSKFAYIYATR